MISWDDRDEGYDCSIRYEAELRMVERERIEQGVPPLVGYKRPVDPACPRHGYGLVRGECGFCVLKRNAETERSAA